MAEDKERLIELLIKALDGLADHEGVEPVYALSTEEAIELNELRIKLIKK